MTTSRLPGAVLFDWDGTLVDTMSMIYRANVVALRSYGITMSREWFRERYTPDWRQSYRELGIPPELWDEMAGRWTDEMVRMRPRALPWARPALRRLRSHGIRVGLVTASTRAVVEPSIARLNLTGVFETAFYSDDVARSKPHPEALLLAMEELGVAPRDTTYVGDTPVDLEMTRAAGPRSWRSGRRRRRRSSGRQAWIACGAAWAHGRTTSSAAWGPGWGSRRAAGARAPGRVDRRTGPTGRVPAP